MTTEEATFEPVRKSVRVDRTAEEAFRLFTEHIDRWWPVEVFSRAADEQYGDGVKVERVVFEPRAGGRLYEVTSEGVEGVWAEVVAYRASRPDRARMEAERPAGASDRGRDPLRAGRRRDGRQAGAPGLGQARRTGGGGPRGSRRRMAAPSGALRRAAAAG